MANQEHLDLLKQGSSAWHIWRAQHTNVQPDLSHAILTYANLERADLSEADLSEADLGVTDLTGANLYYANLERADLSHANLERANLRYANLERADLFSAIIERANLERANLHKADLSHAILTYAYLERANLSRADLTGAYLERANLSRADLRYAILNKANLYYANLERADLSQTMLISTNLTNTTLKDCSIYGIAAWDVQLDGAKQINLTITPEDQPTITVDNLKIAQFIYLLLNNAEIREIIDTIAKKAVLILGRFTPERKAVLDALREALRTHGYLPILFDFDKPRSQDFTETVSTLAHLSRFIIADLTDPSSIPQELYAIVPHRMVPIQPLLKESEDSNHPSREYSMFIDLKKKYHWVLSTHRYRELEDLLTSLQTKIIEPAEQKAQELEKR